MFIYFSTSKLMMLVTNFSAYKKMKQTFLIKPNIRVHVHVHVRFTLTHKSATYIDRISCTKAQYFLCIALNTPKVSDNNNQYMSNIVFITLPLNQQQKAPNLLCIYPECINIHPKGISDIRRQISGTYLLP